MSDGTFVWVPGQGPDELALDRMCREFPKPRMPMGEAWFMAPERQMYPELLGELDSLTDEQIIRPLEEMATGPSSFGQRDEWTEWYHYLLPRLIRRNWGWNLTHPLETAITGFITQHPAEERFPYSGFKADALNTLGQAIMATDCWRGGLLNAGACMNKRPNPSGIMRWYEAEGLFAASLFFCLKYLDEGQIEPWFRSVLAIPNPYWQAQVVIWLIGAHPILTGEIEQPAQFPEQEAYRIGWNWSWSISGNYTGDFREAIRRVPFLLGENRKALLDIIRETDMTEFLEEWQTDPELASLAAETAGAPDRFVDLYGRT